MTPPLWVALAVTLLFGFTVFFGAPYVPSRKKEIRRAFKELYPLSPEDTLVDIGSGDGVVLRVAAEYGARAVGYELSPILVLVSRFLCRRNPAITIHLANFWRTEFPAETTVVYTFGDSRDIAKMAGKVEDTATRLNRPLFFISYAIAVPGKTPYKKAEPYYLYLIEPLQRSEA